MFAGVSVRVIAGVVVGIAVGVNRHMKSLQFEAVALAWKGASKGAQEIHSSRCLACNVVVRNSICPQVGRRLRRGLAVGGVEGGFFV